ncbi:MAG: sulfite:cytochrome C oxidoreductase subunit B [Aquificota bacterium]|nr:MAG: sulfite:cytochrome C oxidoreductase subunit B [Aquificota bacterium]
MKRIIFGLLTIIFLINISKAEVKKIELPYLSWKLKDAPGKEVFEKNCLMCHSPGYVFDQSEGKTCKHLWEHVVYQMINIFKAPISKEDAEIIIKYLNENYSNTKKGY